MNSVSPVPVYDAAGVAALLGIEYTAEQLAAIGPPPASAQGFVTFFDPGWSFVRLRQAMDDKGTLFHGRTWYDVEAFAQREDRPGYRQVRSEPLEGSTSKTFAEQQVLVPDGQDVPPVRAVVAVAVVHLLATRQFLFPDCYVRTSDRSLGGCRVVVGGCGRDGVNVNLIWDGDRYAYLGLAVSRKRSCPLPP
jgi:hypothetical protein